MAYPFAPMPTFEEFCKALTDKHGCVLKEKTQHSGFGHQTADVCTIEIRRSAPGQERPAKAVIQKLEKTKPISPYMIRSVCTRLGIDPKEFGFELG